MENIIIIIIVFVWIKICFRQSEKSASHFRKNVIAPLAITYPRPDVSGNPTPDLNDTIKKPAVRYNRFEFSVLPPIPENKEGEDYVEEIEQLKKALTQANYKLRQQQQTTQSLELREKFEVERNTLNKLLSEQTANTEQLRDQVSGLLAEKSDLTAQLVQDRIQTNMVAACNEKRVKKLQKELAAAIKTEKPITKDVACGSDALQVLAVASTQTESIAKEVGCGTEELIPTQTRTTEQEATKDQSCGFVLDFKTMERCRNPRRPFYIPARERTKSPAVPAAAQTAQLHFPVGDIRYQNKPMSGYIVNSDGTKVTYGDDSKSTPKPAAALSTQTTETAGPLVLDQPKARTTDGQVKTVELTVSSTPVERLSLPGNRLLLKNIPSGDYGRIIGSGGSNIRRIEIEYGIVARIKKSLDEDLSLLISGNDEETRQAAADDFIRGLTVTTEFGNLKLSKRIRNTRLIEIGKKFFVRINRPSPSDADGKMTLTGKLTSCQSAYEELLDEIIH